jgi:hypothetical protein
MRFPRFLNVVPTPVRVLASIVVGCAMIIGAITGLAEARSDARVHGLPLSILASSGNLGLGLLVGAAIGTLIMAWVVSLGYVYGDAQRRGMPRVLWTLIAAFIPNLLGFLLYFALRQPIVSPCTNCGQAVTAKQQFCPGCGQPRPATSSAKSSFLPV